jgi:dTDP-4-dehydrorhamnose 3,5-epimerase
MSTRITSAQKDFQHITPQGILLIEKIDGVKIHEGHNIITKNGVTTELFRPEWNMVENPIQHMIHVSLRPGAVSAWHMHRLQTDHIAVIAGMIRLVLYDGRKQSPTAGKIDVFHLSPMRPTLVVIPPGVWHGLQNLSSAETGGFINFFDRAYDYQDPDEWRLPANSPEIPYEFA